MESSLDWLKRRLDLDSGLKKVVLENPSLLAFSVEDNMAPKLNWLQDRLNLDAAQLRKVVLVQPHCWATASRPTWRRSWIGCRRASSWTRRN